VGADDAVEALIPCPFSLMEKGSRNVCKPLYLRERGLG
jgi:hypothetical protein